MFLYLVGPESTAPATATGTAASTSTSKSSHSSGTNAGAIAGGVVGGVVGVALIAALLFFLYKKRDNSHRIAQTSAHTGGREILSSPPPSTWAPSVGQSVYQPSNNLRPYVSNFLCYRRLTWDANAIAIGSR